MKLILIKEESEFQAIVDKNECPLSKPLLYARAQSTRQTWNLPVNEKHGLGQHHDQHHMNKHTQVRPMEA